MAAGPASYGMTESLGLNEFFRIVPETKYTNADTLAKTFTPEEKINPESHEEQNAAFAEHNGDDNPVVTMMMTMYMQGALQYMQGLSMMDIQRIAFETANLGVNGISPQKKYSLKSIPNSEFGGYELLAYYYVSWAAAFPDKVDLLGLPFKSAYEAAKGNFGSGK